MANEVKQKQLTAITWETTGGTNVITLTSLANNAGRKGVVHDFGATFPRRARWQLTTDFAVAPSARNTVGIYWSSSEDNTIFDGTLTSADAAMSDTVTLAQLYFLGNFICANNTTSQVMSREFLLPARYGFPVIFNRSGQALSSTAGDHEFKITPLLDEVQ